MENKIQGNSRKASCGSKKRQGGNFRDPRKTDGRGRKPSTLTKQSRRKYMTPLQALKQLDGTSDFKTWIRVMFACIDAGISYREFDRWSRKGGNYNEKKNRVYWDHALKEARPEKPITRYTLIDAVMNGGITYLEQLVHGHTQLIHNQEIMEKLGKGHTQLIKTQEDIEKLGHEPHEAMLYVPMLFSQSLRNNLCISRCND